MVLFKLLPVIFLIVLGFCLKRFKFLSPQTVGDLKSMVINITLPALIFMTFANSKFDIKYLSIIIVIFFVCCLLLLLGIFAKSVTLKQRYMETLFTGFETGLIGYAMFGLVFGSSQIFKIAIMDIGNSIFINVLLISYIRRVNKETVNKKQVVLSVFKTPTVIAVATGIIASCTGFYHFANGFMLPAAVFSTFSLIGNITTPLICVIIGYQLTIDLKNIMQPVLIALFRLAAGIFAAFLISTLLFERVLHLDKTFETALYVMFMLPPSFGLPLFVKNETEKEGQLLANTIAISTFLSIIAFPILISIR